MNSQERDQRRVAVVSITKLAFAFSKQLEDQQIDIYIDNLYDLDPAELTIAVDEIIRTENFFPSIAKIREVALIGGNDLSSGEAWSEVCQRIQRSGMNGGTKGFSPSTTAAILACGGYPQLCQSSNPSNDRYIFTRAYDAHILRTNRQKVNQKHIISSDTKMPFLANAIKRLT
tara:strand:+ start:257 stop:775 length:519 start_codon:yes stop_codon:yes gene_type:complete